MNASSTPTRMLLAIATGQQVANLLPILHVAAPGDQVCWLWTEERHLAAAGACAATLAEHGIAAEPHPQPLPASPAGVAEWCDWWLQRLPLQGWRFTLVANGGTKILFLALCQRLAPWIDEVVYGEGAPVEVLRLPQGQCAQARHEAPAGPAVTLQAVLACTGHRIFVRGHSTVPRLLWAQGEARAHLPAPLATFMQAQAFATAYEWGEREMGFEFESAVAHRLLAHLQERPMWHGIVSEVWLGVCACRESQPAEQVANWDVLLVMRNGVLVNVECKSGLDLRTEQKDLDSRMHAMHETGSSLAVMWLCSPVPADLNETPWFGRLHGRRQRAISLGQRHLAWTLPGQALHYNFNGRRFTVPPFREQLDELMQAYLPDPAA